MIHICDQIFLCGFYEKLYRLILFIAETVVGSRPGVSGYSRGGYLTQQLSSIFGTQNQPLISTQLQVGPDDASNIWKDSLGHHFIGFESWNRANVSLYDRHAGSCWHRPSAMVFGFMG